MDVGTKHPSAEVLSSHGYKLHKFHEDAYHTSEYRKGPHKVFISPAKHPTLGPTEAWTYHIPKPKSGPTAKLVESGYGHRSLQDHLAKIHGTSQHSEQSYTDYLKQGGRPGEGGSLR
jgi:hypothetical protein